MRKRILSLLLLLTFCFTSMLFTGCEEASSVDELINKEFKKAISECERKAGKTTSGAEFVVPEGGYDGEDVTIKFYSTMSKDRLQPTFDAALERFNAIYPNIHVEHTQPGNYDAVRDQIKTEATAGEHPNLAYCYPDHVALYNLAKITVQLDNLIADPTIGLTDAQKNDFVEGYWNEGQQFGDGHMYTLPFSKSTEVLYYNKTFFDEHGLKTPETWDEMETLCADILKIEKCVPLGYDSEANWFITMCEQYKSGYTTPEPNNHFIFNNEKNKEFVKRFHTWYEKGYVTTQQLFGGYTSGLFVETAPDKTRSYMSIGSSAGATHQRPAKNESGEYPFEVGITTIPQVDPTNPKVISQGPSLCIFHHPKLDAAQDNREVIASWLLAKFLTTDVEFQAKFSMVSGYVPVIKSVADNPVYKEFLDGADGGNGIAALSAKICTAQEAAYYASPAFNGSSTARDAVGTLLINCMKTAVKEEEPASEQSK